MTLDALIFDMDGTLLDTNAAHVDAWVEGLARHDYRIPPARIRPGIGMGGDQLLPSLLGDELDDAQAAAIRASVAEAFRRIARERHFRAFDGAVRLLDDVRARGLRLALATSASEEDLEAIMRSARLDLREWFDAVVTTSDVDASKPEPDVVLAATRKLGLSPARVRLTSAVEERLMRAALLAAREGLSVGEAPIGCAIADGEGEVLVRAHNEERRSGAKTSHAEMVAFARLGGRVPSESRDLLLISTLEPCVMCTGAAMVGAVDTVVFGMRAPADGGAERVRPAESPGSRMPRFMGEVLARECRALVEEWMEQVADAPQASYGRQLLAATKPDGSACGDADARKSA